MGHCRSSCETGVIVGAVVRQGHCRSSCETGVIVRAVVRYGSL